eukprot:gene26496-biopygen3709
MSRGRCSRPESSWNRTACQENKREGRVRLYRGIGMMLGKPITHPPPFRSSTGISHAYPGRTQTFTHGLIRIGTLQRHPGDNKAALSLLAIDGYGSGNTVCYEVRQYAGDGVGSFESVLPEQLDEWWCGEVVWGFAPHNFPTPPLPPSISPPHLEWVLVPPTLTMDSYVHDTSKAAAKKEKNQQQPMQVKYQDKIEYVSREPMTTLDSVKYDHFEYWMLPGGAKESLLKEVPPGKTSNSVKDSLMYLDLVDRPAR